MPVIESTKKALRRDRRRTTVNQQVRRRTRTAIKQFRKKPTKKNLKLVYSLLDRATKKNLFHKNKSSRLKSRLSRLL